MDTLIKNTGYISDHTWFQVLLFAGPLVVSVILVAIQLYYSHRMKKLELTDVAEGRHFELRKVAVLRVLDILAEAHFRLEELRNAYFSWNTAKNLEEKSSWLSAMKEHDCFLRRWKWYLPPDVRDSIIENASLAYNDARTGGNAPTDKKMKMPDDWDRQMKRLESELDKYIASLKVSPSDMV